MRSFFAIAFCFIVSACSDNTQQQKTSKNIPAATEPAVVDTISLQRSQVNSDPVAEYSKKTDNPLNDWYFRVRLYETPKTFHYLMKMQFEEIVGEDTLKLPNFGLMPQPVIQPGKETYSCIIGFHDKQGNFREYKKVYVKNNSLKVTTLRHYAVRTY